MPLPYWLTRVNLHFGNRIVRPFAAWLPWFVVLEHVGRTSGIIRSNPVMAYRHDDQLVIALPYGTKVQWLKNVLAAGGGRVRRYGRWWRVTDPHRFRDRRRARVPLIVRPFLALLRVDEFVEVQLSPVETSSS